MLPEGLSSVASYETLRAAWDASTLDAESCLRAALDLLLRSCGADRAVVFLGHAVGVAAPWVARCPEGDVPIASQEDVTRSLVLAAFAERRAVSWDAAGDTRQSASASQLGIVAAWAAPCGLPPTAVLYLDHRRVSRHLGADLTALAAPVLALLDDILHGTARPPLPRRAPTLDPPNLDELSSLPGTRAQREAITLACRAASPVLLTGETGSGKTLLAQAIAARMGRTPVVRAMLGTSDDPNTMVSELYGHERGAFSGAATRRAGLVEKADGGVLILDEVINLPLSVQQILLDFVQFQTYRPLGYAGVEPRRANVAIISVTNGDLEGAIRQGRFRKDLYYRLAGTVIHLPPLRARRGDIPALCDMLLRRIDGSPWRLSLAARRALLDERRGWPGNVRELESLLRRAVERACIEPSPMPWEILPRPLDEPPAQALAPEPPRVEAAPAGAPVGVPESRDLAARWRALQSRRDELDREERGLIEAAMEAHGQVLAHAAAALGVPRTTLASRLGAERRGR